MYFIKEGFKGIRRHWFISFASIAIIAACLLTTVSMLLLTVNLDYNLEHLMGECELAAYIDENTTLEQKKVIAQQIAGIDHVVGYNLISSEEAMKRYASRMGGSQFYEDLPNQVLNERYYVQIDEPAEMENIVAKVENIDGVSNVVASLKVAHGFSSTKSVTFSVSMFLVVSSLVISALIITNSTRLAMQGREDEIMVMKMVGATPLFVRGPFLVEGAVMGLASGFVALLLEIGFYQFIEQLVQQYQITVLFTMIDFQKVIFWLILGLLLGGLLVGIFGAMIAIHRLVRY